MKKTLINNKWELLLPDHRAARPEWPVWEKERLAAIHDEIERWFRPGLHPIVFDIGAEEGDFPALYSKWGADVVLFEPNDRVWPNIKAIWDANKLKAPLKTFSGFASSIDDYELKDIEGPIWPQSSRGEVIGDHGFKELADNRNSIIPEIKLDTFCEDLFITPQIITIDVEGSEFEVLKGAEAVLKDTYPTVFVSIHPEFMYHHFKQYTAELVKYMTDLGYTYEILAFDHEFHFCFRPGNEKLQMI